jgi:hypothetical protein
MGADGGAQAVPESGRTGLPHERQRSDSWYQDASASRSVRVESEE